MIPILFLRHGETDKWVLDCNFVPDKNQIVVFEKQWYVVEGLRHYPEGSKKYKYDKEFVLLNLGTYNIAD